MHQNNNYFKKRILVKREMGSDRNRTYDMGRKGLENRGGRRSFRGSGRRWLVEISPSFLEFPPHLFIITIHHLQMQTLRINLQKKIKIWEGNMTKRIMRKLLLEGNLMLPRKRFLGDFDNFRDQGKRKWGMSACFFG